MKKTLTFLTAVLCTSLCFATLSTDYDPAQYNTNGSTTQYSVQWGFFSTSDLVVYYTDSDGIDTTLTEGAGAGKYTVYAANSDYSSGATITTGTTYPSGGRITIERLVPYGQSLSINGDFVPAKPLETQLDKLAAQTQQILDEQGRTLTIPITDASGLTTEFPNSSTRANKAAYFDANGNATVVSLVASGTVAGDDTSIAVSTNNIISIKADGVTSNELADLSVLNTNIVDDAIQTRNILDGDVTLAKLDDLNARSVMGNVTGAEAAVTAVAIIDDNTMATATTNNLATSESIKAYVDLVRPQYIALTNHTTTALSTNIAAVGSVTNTYTIAGFQGDGLITANISEIHGNATIRIDGATSDYTLTATYPGGTAITVMDYNLTASNGIDDEELKITFEVPVNSDTTSITFILTANSQQSSSQLTLTLFGATQYK